MPFEIFHFRESDRVLQEKNLDRDFQATMQYLDDVFIGSLYRRELLRDGLERNGLAGKRQFEFPGRAALSIQRLSEWDRARGQFEFL